MDYDLLDPLAGSASAAAAPVSFKKKGAKKAAATTTDSSADSTEPTASATGASSSTSSAATGATAPTSVAAELSQLSVASVSATANSANSSSRSSFSSDSKTATATTTTTTNSKFAADYDDDATALNSASYNDSVHNNNNNSSSSSSSSSSSGGFKTAKFKGKSGAGDASAFADFSADYHDDDEFNSFGPAGTTGPRGAHGHSSKGDGSAESKHLETLQRRRILARARANARATASATANTDSTLSGNNSDGNDGINAGDDDADAASSGGVSGAVVGGRYGPKELAALRAANLSTTSGLGASAENGSTTAATSSSALRVYSVEELSTLHDRGQLSDNPFDNPDANNNINYNDNIDKKSAVDLTNDTSDDDADRRRRIALALGDDTDPSGSLSTPFDAAERWDASEAPDDATVAALAAEARRRRAAAVAAAGTAPLTASAGADSGSIRGSGSAFGANHSVFDEGSGDNKFGSGALYRSAAEKGITFASAAPAGRRPGSNSSSRTGYGACVGYGAASSSGGEMEDGVVEAEWGVKKDKFDVTYLSDSDSDAADGHSAKYSTTSKSHAESAGGSRNRPIELNDGGDDYDANNDRGRGRGGGRGGGLNDSDSDRDDYTPAPVPGGGGAGAGASSKASSTGASSASSQMSLSTLGGCVSALDTHRQRRIAAALKRAEAEDEAAAAARAASKEKLSRHEYLYGDTAGHGKSGTGEGAEGSSRGFQRNGRDDHNDDDDDDDNVQREWHKTLLARSGAATSDIHAVSSNSVDANPSAALSSPAAAAGGQTKKRVGMFSRRANDPFSAPATAKAASAANTNVSSGGAGAGANAGDAAVGMGRYANAAAAASQSLAELISGLTSARSHAAAAVSSSASASAAAASDAAFLHRSLEKLTLAAESAAVACEARAQCQEHVTRLAALLAARGGVAAAAERAAARLRRRRGRAQWRAAAAHYSDAAAAVEGEGFAAAVATAARGGDSATNANSNSLTNSAAVNGNNIEAVLGVCGNGGGVGADAAAAAATDVALAAAASGTGSKGMAAGNVSAPSSVEAVRGFRVRWHDELPATRRARRSTRSLLRNMLNNNSNSSSSSSGVSSSGSTVTVYDRRLGWFGSGNVGGVTVVADVLTFPPLTPAPASNQNNSGANANANASASVIDSGSVAAQCSMSQALTAGSAFFAVTLAEDSIARVSANAGDVNNTTNMRSGLTSNLTSPLRGLTCGLAIECLGVLPDDSRLHLKHNPSSSSSSSSSASSSGQSAVSLTMNPGDAALSSCLTALDSVFAGAAPDLVHLSPLLSHLAAWRAAAPASYRAARAPAAAAALCAPLARVDCARWRPLRAPHLSALPWYSPAFAHCDGAAAGDEDADLVPMLAAAVAAPRLALALAGGEWEPMGSKKERRGMKNAFISLATQQYKRNYSQKTMKDDGDGSNESDNGGGGDYSDNAKAAVDDLLLHCLSADPDSLHFHFINNSSNNANNNPSISSNSNSTSHTGAGGRTSASATAVRAKPVLSATSAGDRACALVLAAAALRLRASVAAVAGAAPALGYLSQAAPLEFVRARRMLLLPRPTYNLGSSPSAGNVSSSAASANTGAVSAGVEGEAEAVAAVVASAGSIADAEDDDKNGSVRSSINNNGSSDDDERNGNTNDDEDEDESEITPVVWPPLPARPPDCMGLGLSTPLPGVTTPWTAAHWAVARARCARALCLLTVIVDWRHSLALLDASAPLQPTVTTSSTSSSSSSSSSSATTSATETAAVAVAAELRFTAARAAEAVLTVGPSAATAAAAAVYSGHAHRTAQLLAMTLLRQVVLPFLSAATAHLRALRVARKNASHNASQNPSQQSASASQSSSVAVSTHASTPLVWLAADATEGVLRAEAAAWATDAGYVRTVAVAHCAALAAALPRDWVTVGSAVPGAGLAAEAPGPVGVSLLSRVAACAKAVVAAAAAEAEAEAEAGVTESSGQATATATSTATVESKSEKALQQLAFVVNGEINPPMFAF